MNQMQRMPGRVAFVVGVIEGLEQLDNDLDGTRLGQMTALNFQLVDERREVGPQKQSSMTPAQFISYFRSYSYPIMMYGLVNPSDSTRLRAVIQEFGKYGDIANTNDLTTVFDQMIDDIVGAVNKYELSQSPIAATIKLAFDNNTPLSNNGDQCVRSDVPRSTAHGFAYDGNHKTLLFYGDCRPITKGYDIAASYRYWNDITHNPEGVDEKCEVPLETCNMSACVCLGGFN